MKSRSFRFSGARTSAGGRFAVNRSVPDHVHKLHDGNGLQQVREGPGLRRVFFTIERVVPGEHDHLGGRVQTLDFSEHTDPVHAGHS